MSAIVPIYAWAILVALLVVLVWGLLRQWKVVPVGQEALQYAVGNYVRTLQAGRHFVNPLMPIVLFPEGTTTKFHVGEKAIVVQPISLPGPPGRISVAGIELAALPLRYKATRSQSLPIGSIVLIQGPRLPDSVYVTPIRSGQPNG